MVSDAELVGLVRRGDVEAFARLVERYEKSVLAVAGAELRDFRAAEDVAQETLVLAFRRLHTLRDGAKFGSWLRARVERVARGNVSVRISRQYTLFCPFFGKSSCF